MKLSDVMDEIGRALSTIPDLRVVNYETDSIQPPTAIVQFPAFDYDRAFQRGMDRWEGGVIVAVSRVWDRTARDNIAKYVDGHSSQSIHAALRNHTWTTCSYARATTAVPLRDFEVGQIVYAAYQIELDIAGPGT